MKAAVIVFPGSNCDRDVCVALEHATGQKPATVWHRDSDLPKVDLIAAMTEEVALVLRLELEPLPDLIGEVQSQVRSLARHRTTTLAAYHAGQGSVDHWRAEGLGILFPETRDYVEEVERLTQVYADAYRDELRL